MDSSSTRKRRRVAFSCGNCRQRRQRCDRRFPCTSCVRSNRQDTCYYSSGSLFNSGSGEVTEPTHSSASQLESPSLVLASSQSTHSTLQTLGYSRSSAYNSLGICQRLQKEQGSQVQPVQQHDENIEFSSDITEAYAKLLRRLPPRIYLELLIGVYFKEVHWHYAFLDELLFKGQLNQFYSDMSNFDCAKRLVIKPKMLYAPSLLFQIAALAFQFMPHEHDHLLDDLCVGGKFPDLARGCSESGQALLNLFGSAHRNLAFVQAELLRVYWLKNEGKVVESWDCLGRLISEAHEMGLFQDQFQFHEAGDSCIDQWNLQMRRRIQVNLYLWDSEMATVLGKPMNLKIHECKMALPLDTETPPDWERSLPSERQDFERPGMFSFRLVEYRLQKFLPEIRSLESGGPSWEDLATVQRLHAQAIEYIESLPSHYRFLHPNGMHDNECPWLIPQRFYLRSITWFFVLALHKPYIFLSARSREEAVKAGTSLLRAQQDMYDSIEAHHYRLFTLVFMTLEPTVVLLSILMSFPDDSRPHAPEILSMVQDGLLRLRAIQTVNPMANTAADMIQRLLDSPQAAWLRKASNENSTLSLQPSWPGPSHDVSELTLKATRFDQWQSSGNLTASFVPGSEVGTKNASEGFDSSTSEYLLDLNCAASFLQPTADLLRHEGQSGDTIWQQIDQAAPNLRWGVNRETQNDGHLVPSPADFFGGATAFDAI